MSRLWKTFLVLAVVLPVSAYVIGSLVASGTDRPAERAPVVLLDAPTSENGDEDAKPDKTRGDTTDSNTKRNRGDDEGDGSPEDDDNRPAVVTTPKPTPVDDDWDDRHDDDDDRTDDDDGVDD